SLQPRSDGRGEPESVRPDVGGHLYGHKVNRLRRLGRLLVQRNPADRGREFECDDVRARDFHGTSSRPLLLAVLSTPAGPGVTFTRQSGTPVESPHGKPNPSQSDRRVAHCGTTTPECGRVGHRPRGVVSRPSRVASGHRWAAWTDDRGDPGRPGSRGPAGGLAGDDDPYPASPFATPDRLVRGRIPTGVPIYAGSVDRPRRAGRRVRCPRRGSRTGRGPQTAPGARRRSE